MDTPQRRLVTSPDYQARFDGVTIYGVAGTNGAGKDELMRVLADAGFLVYSTSDDLRRVAQAVFRSTARGGGHTPMGQLGNAQRAGYPGGMVDLGLLDWWARIDHLPPELQPQGLVIGSIRSVSEVRRLKDFGGQLILVDADPKLRYERTVGRGRADEHAISYKQFLAAEQNEMGQDEADPAKFSMAEVIAMADITLMNNSSDLSRFEAEARSQLGI